MTDPTQLPIFADGKEPDALRTIGEVAAALGIRQHVLRYWEAQFPMLQPLKRSGGRRYYRRADIELVGAIDRLVNREGYTLKGARQALEKKAVQLQPVPPELVEGPSFLSVEPEEKNGPLRRSSGQASTRSGQADLEMLSSLTAIRDRLAAALAA